MLHYIDEVVTLNLRHGQLGVTQLRGDDSVFIPPFIRNLTS